MTLINFSHSNDYATAAHRSPVPAINHPELQTPNCSSQMDPPAEKHSASEGTHSLNSHNPCLVPLLIPSPSTTFSPTPAGDETRIQQAGVAVTSQSSFPSHRTTHPGQQRNYSCGKKCVIGIHNGDGCPAKGLTYNQSCTPVSEHLTL